MTTTQMTHDDVRMRLTARRDELAKRLARLGADRRREAEPLSMDSADRAIQRENDDVVDSITSTAEGELSAIDAALRRLDAGRYGVCDTCRAPIEATRLRALPHTMQCQRCASES